MRILFLSHSPDNPSAGASRIYHFLSGELVRRGFEVDTFHLESFGLPKDPKRRLLDQRLFMPRKVSAFGLTQSPLTYDVIMSSSGMAAPLFEALRPQPRRPLLVGHIHGLAIYDHLAAHAERVLGHDRPSLWNRMVTGPMQIRWDEAGIRHADLTIVQNQRDFDFVSGVKPHHGDLVAIPAAVHPNLHQASLAVEPDAARAPNLLWFASWESRKGAHYVPGALRKIRSVSPDVRLTIAGTGCKAQDILPLFDEADRSSVTVLPFLSLAEQVELYSRSGVILFPSTSEGFGLALIEAMCFGLVAVSGSTGFAADYIRDGVNGVLVGPSETHIADGVLRAIQDAPSYRAMALKGAQLARRFTLNRMADAYEASFVDALATRRSGLPHSNS